MVDSELYKRDASSGVLTKCIPRAEGKEALEEIHEGTCGNHAASRTIVGRAFRSGFYWPIVVNDAEEIVRAANSSPDELTFLLKHYKQSHHHGLSHAGGWTWWGHSKQRPAALTISS